MFQLFNTSVFPRFTNATPIRINPEAMNTVKVSGSFNTYHPKINAIIGLIYA